ncbi:uncharacterized protein LOC144709475 isoform X2 [Wolffia australiana]
MKVGGGASQAMALSVGPSSISIFRSSLSPQRQVQPIHWRTMEAIKFGLFSNMRGSSYYYRFRSVDGRENLVRNIYFANATSGNQRPNDELSNDVDAINGMNDVDDINDDNDTDVYSDSDLVEGNSEITSVQSSVKSDSDGPSVTSDDSKEDEKVSSPRNDSSNIFLFIGPTALVASLVFPSFYLRRILLAIFEDSLFTDFLILFFTEALFYGGVAVYVLLTDYVYRNQNPAASNSFGQINTNFGLRVLSVATLVLSLIIPLVTMGMVWPWTGPAASATLAPYLVGIVVQFAFEQYARYKRSTSCAIIPVVFQVYRLHQLNRATQLVTALSYSVRGVETTAQTVAINNSLGTLLNVLQLLGVICIWSLSSFLMRFLPSSTSLEP